MKGMNNLTIRCAQIIAMIQVLDEDGVVVGVDSEGRAALCESMDLAEDDLNELFVTASRIADKYIEGFDEAGLSIMLAHDDVLWQNNNVQMPRLLTEIMGTVDGVDLDAVNRGLQISRSDLVALLDAAHEAWEAAKGGRVPTATGFVAIAVAHLPGDEEDSVQLIDVGWRDSRADIVGKVEVLLYEEAGLDREAALAAGGRTMYLDSLLIIDGRVVSEELTPR